MSTAHRMDRYLEPTARNQAVQFSSVHGPYLPPPPRMTGHVVSTSWTHRRGGSRIIECGQKVKTLMSDVRKPVQKLTWKLSAPPVFETQDSNVNSMTITDLSPRTALKKILLLFENRLYRETANFISRLNHDTFKLVLSDLPTEEFVKSMPQSLSVLEALYAKVFLSDGLNFSVKTLRPEQVVMQMVKYFAKISESDKCVDPSFIGSCKKLLKVILLSDSKIRKNLYQKKRTLDKTIEGLGHHGLVGTSDESLTNLHDALKVEFDQVVHSYKEAMHKLEELALSSKTSNHKSVNNGPAPIEASHQRQLSLNQSEIQERLIKNKTVLNVVEPTLSNHSLDLFLGILQRRIEYDKDALFQYTQLRKEMKEVADGPVANILMRYSYGCEKVLELMKEVSTDFDGDNEDDSSDVSGYHSDSDSAIMMTTGNSPFVSKATRANFLTRSVRISERGGIRTSLLLNTSDLTNGKPDSGKDSSSASVSSGNSEQETKVGKLQLHRKHTPPSSAYESSGSICDRCNSRDSVIIQIPSTQDIGGRDATVTNLQGELEKLKGELSRARCQLTALQEKEGKLRDRLASQAKSMTERHVSLYCDQVIDGERAPSALIRRYGNLYAQARVDTMDALDRLEQLNNCGELKTKLLFSVIVLSYRSTNARATLIKEHIKKILQIRTPEVKVATQSTAGPPPPPPLPDRPIGSKLMKSSGIVEKKILEKRRSAPVQQCDSVDAMKGVESSLELYLRKTGDDFDVTKLVEEVCTQIWATLYDYPFLKDSDVLLSYVQDCVRLSWNLVNQNPPFILEYEARSFSPDLHVRFHSSNPKSATVKTYLWPALLEGIDGKCVHKAVVVT